MNNTIKFSVSSQNSGKRLDIFLTENIDNYTRSFLKKLIENKLSLRQGNLVLTGTPLSLHTVKIGDDIRIMVDDYEFVSCKII